MGISYAPDDVYWNENKECFNQYVHRLIQTKQVDSNQFKTLKKIYGLEYLVKMAKTWEERHCGEKPYRKG